MEQVFEAALKSLHDFAGDPELAGELAEAKKEFFAVVGAPLPGEPIEELRLSSLAEWFIFDRPISSTGRTPVEEYQRRYASELSAEETAALQGFARSVHSVFLLKKRIGRSAFLVDLYSGIKFKDARRVPVTLGKGDMAELRLVPAGELWFATDALCYHPYVARKNIKKMLKTARKNGEPLDPLLLKLMAMNTRYERFPKTAKESAYAEGGLAGIPRA